MKETFEVIVAEETSVFKTVDIKVEGRYAACVRIIKPAPRCGRKEKITLQASTGGPRSLETVKKFAAAVQHAIKLAEIEKSRSLQS